MALTSMVQLCSYNSYLFGRNLPPWCSKIHKDPEGPFIYDMKNLAKLKLLDAKAPEGMKAFWSFDKAAMAAGAIPVKYKELIAREWPSLRNAVLHRNSFEPGARGGSVRSGNCRDRSRRGGIARRGRNHARNARHEGARIGFGSSLSKAPKRADGPCRRCP